MACRDAYKMNKPEQAAQDLGQQSTKKAKTTADSTVTRLLFGVDSEIQANDVLQNNLTEFEWAVRNKVYPNFWGRNLVGENCLTKEEIDFLHGKGCKIAALYTDDGEKSSEEQGKLVAKKMSIAAFELGIPEGTAIFLELGKEEAVTRNYMKGYAQTLISEGYTPGFRADTDAKYSFDREYSRGMQTDKELFEKCLIWALSPSLAEYDRVTTTHLIHPDNWIPFAPSGITRKEIAVWQYGKNCHPIYDDKDYETTFNINLVRNKKVIIEKMF